MNFVTVLRSYWSLFLIFQLPLNILEFNYFLPMKKREHFVLRLVLSLIGMEVTMLLPAYLFTRFYSDERAWFANIVTFLPMFLFSLIPAFVCFKEKPRRIFYYGTIAYTLQHILSRLFSLFGMTLSLNGISMGSSYMYYELIWFAVSLTALYFLLIRRDQKKANEKMVTVPVLIFSLIVVIFTFLLSNISSYYIESNSIPMILVWVYDLGASVIVIVVHEGLLDKNQYREENEIIEQMWEEDKKNMEAMNENINIINIKCHDMKHQINRLLQNKESISEEDKKEIDQAISIYDSSIQTGNKMLDTLLTQAKLTCEKKNIRLSAMVDGKALSFLSEADIYSLFGNAIDNAIEAVEPLPEEKRVISVSTNHVGSMLSVQFMNYYQGEVKLGSNGLPLTSKEDKNYHGYGTRSMLAVVKKYNGSLTIHPENGEYHLNLLFPLN